MRLAGIELRRIAMPLRSPFRSASGIEHERDILLVRIETDDGVEGWGECGALATPHYTSEYVDGAAAVIERFLAPAMLAPATAELDAEGVAPALAWCKGHPMAKAVLEMAVLDAELRARATPLHRHLGGTSGRVPAGVAVGLFDDRDALVAAVTDFVAQGYRRIKLKIEPGHDVDPVRAVREGIGPDVVLQVDANGAYGNDDDAARQLGALDPFGLAMIEQPLADDDLRGHAALARRIQTPICLDESITSARVAAEAIALGACEIVNIKAARVGGYLEARRVHDTCASNGVAVWCGGMLETGLGRAANVALASLPGFTLPGDLSASDRYWDVDLTAPFVLHDGHLDVPTGPGIGVEPLPDVLRAVTRSSTWLRA